MQVYCLHHQNAGFLGQLLTNLLNGESEVLRVAVPRGSLSLGNGEATLLGEDVQCVVTTTQGSTLLTTSSCFAEHNRTVIDYSLESVTQALPIRQLVNLCLDKHIRSQHQFSLDVALDGCSVTIKPDRGQSLMFTFKRPDCEVVRSSHWAERDVFDGSATIKAFSSRVKTDSMEKEVVVKRDAVEILREVAKYLGKTIVLFNPDVLGEYSGVGISASGVCTFGKNGKGTPTAFSVPPSKLRLPKDAFLFTTSTSVRDLTRGHPLFTLREVVFSR